MTQEHARLALLFREYQSLKDGAPEQAGRLLERFADGLERHMTLEEEILFPRFEAVSHMGNTGPTTIMRAEHAEIRKALSLLGTLRAGEEPRLAAEEILIDSLRAHEAMEDLVFSPWIDESLSENERLGLFEQIRHYPAAPA
jgi:iron-sulfur cluster repair protein YtfE (RIC family)